MELRGGVSWYRLLGGAAARSDALWAGSTVRPQEIRDIPAYNRACARLWWSYGAVYVLAGAASLFSMLWAGVITAAACLPGLPVLIFAYGRIYRKYKQ